VTSGRSGDGGLEFAGGDIAAPVTQIVLRAALAARDAALDRDDLAASEKEVAANASSTQKGRDAARLNAKDAGDTKVRGVAADPGSYDPNGNIAADKPEPPPPSYLVELNALPRRAPAPVTARAVPDVRGLSIREAVRTLHGAGFRVRLLGSYGVGTQPVAGTLIPPGSIVELARPLE